jgi:cytochrome c biogenesis protein CcdA
LATAIIGALIIGSGGGIDGVNGFVESLSGGTSRELGSWGLLAPLGFAFALGMVSAANPCGFAMLPAYLGLYLGDVEKETGHVNPARQFRQAMVVGGTVTAGIAVLFGVVGFVVSLGAGTFIREVLPLVGLSIGVILALLGSWMVGGRKLYTGIAARAASNIGDPSQVSLKGYFMFGISYATASLSCTIGLFLALVGTSLSLSSIGTSLGQFFLYALGMGAVITALTLGMAFFKTAMVGALKKSMPYIQPVGSWLMVIAGMYIVFYWLTIGEAL